MSTCCDTFETNVTEVERVPNPVFHPLDRCGNKAEYKATEGEDYKVGMPVKFGDDGMVEPALDGVDAIGISLSEFIGATGDKVMVQRTGRGYWRDIAPAIGKDATSESDWFAIHKELAKANFYVEFK